MKFIKRKILQSISNLNNNIYSRSFPRMGCRILMYHSIGSKAYKDKKNLFSLSENQFKDQMDYIYKNYKNSLTSLDIKKVTSKTFSISITFDDGYKDNLYIAAPIILEKGFPISVFITTDFVEKNFKNFLNKKEISHLASLNRVTIGSHGKTHRSLANCSSKEVRNELEYSKKFLEDIVGYEVDKISYPFGSCNTKTKLIAEECGYKVGLTSYENTNTSSKNNLLLSRTAILSIDSNRIFKQKLYGYWDWYRFIQKVPYKHD